MCLARAMGEKRRDGDSSSKKEKKSKRDADGAEDAAARAERKAAKRAKKDGGGGGGGGAADDGSVARVRVSGIPPGADAAKIAKFLGVDASKVVVLSGEATAIMPDAAAAKRAAADLDETKFAGRFVRVARDDFRPEDVATAPPARATPTTTPTPKTTPPSTASAAAAVAARWWRWSARARRVASSARAGRRSREIEELTGCVLRIRQEEGICEVSGRDVKAAVQEIKNIVEEGRERDGGNAQGGSPRRLRRSTRRLRPRRVGVRHARALRRASVRRPTPGKRVATRHGRERLDVSVRIGQLRAPPFVFPMRSAPRRHDSGNRKRQRQRDRNRDRKRRAFVPAVHSLHPLRGREWCRYRRDEGSHAG